MSTDPFTRPLGSLRPEPKRDRLERYLLPNPDSGKEQAWTRVTTFAKAVVDDYNINQWEKRLVAKGIATRADLYALAAATPVEDKKKLDKIAADAKEAARGSSGANLGTALHTFAEYKDAGVDIHVPQPWDADLAAYRAKLAEKRITVHPEWIERIVLLTQYQAAGTFDRIVTLSDGRQVIADLKTGQDLYFDTSPIQLACYANATHIIDLATGQPTPMPQVDQDIALIIHLPAGKASCEIHEIDIKAGWETAYICSLVRQWRARRDLARIYQPTDNPWLLGLIAQAPDRVTLERLYGDYRGDWNDTHTLAAQQRVAELRETATEGVPA